MADKKDGEACEPCLIVKVTRPSGCTDPRIDVTLGVRGPDPYPVLASDACEYPRTPETVGGLASEHGSLGVYTWTHDGRLSFHGAVEYERLAYVDAYKLSRYAKTLALIVRRIDKMRDARGPASTWTDYILRFAEATGAKWIAFPADTLHRSDRARGHEPRDMRGEKWQFFKPGDAAYILRGLEESFAPEKDIANPASAAS